MLGRPAMALAAALPLLVCGAAPAAADVVLPEEPAPQERVAATVNPALVRVTGTFGGWVRSPGGASGSGWPYTVVFTCSAFGVHPDGYLATAGHCIDANDPGVLATFIRGAAERYARERPDMPVERIVDWGRSAWVVEGRDAGSPVESEIRVTGIAGSPPDGVFARVVDDRPIGQGDVGLLKVDTTDLPTLELATGAGVAVGTPVLAAGYPESAGDGIRPGTTPQVEAGTVVETSTEGGRPLSRMDVPPDVGMSGGATLDADGRVVGINTYRTSGSQLISVVIPVGTFTDLLGRNGVQAQPGPRDLRYREAVDAYFSGEYTDAIVAIDGLERDGTIHPRLDQLRSDAQAARDLHGDASENFAQHLLFWVGIGTATLVIVALAAVVLARSRRKARAGTGPSPYPSVPGPPWPGRPGAPFPPQAGQPVPRNQPYGPHQRAGAAPGPVSGGPFGAPPRTARHPHPAPGSEDPTVTVPAPRATTAAEPLPSAPAGDRNDRHGAI